MTNEDGDVENAGGTLEVLDPTGHFELRWGKKKSEIEAAEATFKDLLAKGYLAFKKKWFGRKGEEVKSFNPNDKTLIFDKVESPTDDAEEKAKTEAKLKWRVAETKKAHDEAVKKAGEAKVAHEEATRKRRDASMARSVAEARIRKAKDGLASATKRRKAVEEALASPEEPVDERPTDALRGEVVAAEAEAQKACDESVESARKAAAAFDEADEAEKAAYAAKREAEKLASSTEREYEDAMTALHGSPTSEQTREFDKEGKTTMTPPFRGG